MLSLLRLLNGISMTKSGKIKSKSDKLTKFFLDFADVFAARHPDGFRSLLITVYALPHPVHY